MKPAQPPDWQNRLDLAKQLRRRAWRLHIGTLGAVTLASAMFGTLSLLLEIRPALGALGVTAALAVVLNEWLLNPIKKTRDRQLRDMIERRGLRNIVLVEAYYRRAGHELGADPGYVGTEDGRLIFEGARTRFEVPWAVVETAEWLKSGYSAELSMRLSSSPTSISLRTQDGGAARRLSEVLNLCLHTQAGKGFSALQYVPPPLEPEPWSGRLGWRKFWRQSGSKDVALGVATAYLVVFLAASLSWVVVPLGIAGLAAIVFMQYRSIEKAEAIARCAFSSPTSPVVLPPAVAPPVRERLLS